MARAVHQAVARQIHPDRIGELDQEALMNVVAIIWSDVELASVLYGSEQFFWERLLHYAERGYLTAQEDQGTRRLLALSYRRQLLGLMGEKEREPTFELDMDDVLV